MKLLHTEIDVVPGRKPQKQPLPEGFVGAGTAVLRITNTTSRQNAYTVRIRCEEPFWQDAWFQVAALPPTGGPENQPPAGKPDQPGPRNQSLTIYVQDGGTRDVFLSFFVPEKSECRAGAYPVKLVVETRIVSNDPQLARKERVTEIPALVIVRPFYKWTVSYQPEERKVGFFKRGKEFEVCVDNQSNDWLYCDLKLPRPQNVLVETPTVRMAVPPPEPGADSVRTVPFKAISRVKTIRGEHQPMPLPITVQRVHAPTVPPLPEEAQFGPSGANAGAAVVATETTDIGNPEVPATLIYCPLIPSTLTGFFQALFSNARQIIMALVGIIIAWNIAVFTYEYFWRSVSEITVLRTQIELGKPFEIRGRNLIGAKILVFDETGKNQIGEPINPKYSPQNAIEQQVAVVLNDKSLDGKQIKIGAQRAGAMTFLKGFLPVAKDSALIQVGKPKEKPLGPAVGSINQEIQKGQPLEIGGTNFGAKKGRVMLNGENAVIQSWTNTKITVRIPAKFQNGAPVSVLLVNANEDPIQLTPNMFVVLPEDGGFPDPGTTGGDPTTTGDDPTTSGGDPGTTGGTGGTGSTGGTGASGGSGSTGGGPAPGMQTPSGYNSLLSDTRAGYAAAVKAAKGNSVGANAVKAYALASIGKVDEAKQALVRALTALGSREQGLDVALVYIAQARVVDKLGGDADKAYAIADEKANLAAPGFPFVDIAIARYKISKGSWGEAGALLRNAQTNNPSPAETEAIERMLQQVANRQS